MHEKRACQSSATWLARASMEIGCGPNQRVESLAQAMLSQRLVDIDMGAPSPAHARRHRSVLRRGRRLLAGHPMDRFLKRLLDGRPMILPLPAHEGPPSYSIVSRQRVTEGSCPSGSGSRAAVHQPSWRLCPRAGPSAAGWPVAGSNGQAVVEHLPGSPGWSSAACASSSLIRSPSASNQAPGLGRKRGPAARSRRRLRSSRSAPRPCRSSARRWRRLPAASAGGWLVDRRSHSISASAPNSASSSVT